jgi:hypothetical protein
MAQLQRNFGTQTKLVAIDGSPRRSKPDLCVIVLVEAISRSPFRIMTLKNVPVVILFHGKRCGDSHESSKEVRIRGRPRRCVVATPSQVRDVW